MANIRDLRKKIKSTKSTLKITSAMKLVSAAKFSRAQARIVGSRPYANELETTIKTVSALCKGYEHDFLKGNPENKHAVMLVISSNKGLCGSFNSSLAKEIRKFMTQNNHEQFKVYFVGKKVRDLLSKEVNVGKTFYFEKDEANFDEVRKVADELSALFRTGEVGKIYVAYNMFVSAINIKAKVEKVLPLTLSEKEKGELQEKFPFDFKYDPTPDAILDTLIPEAYITSIYTKILDSIASEHSSRMNAMENATKNSKEMIHKLTITMNKKRQAAITTELIEVVSGAESLNA